VYGLHQQTCDLSGQLQNTLAIRTRGVAQQQLHVLPWFACLVMTSLGGNTQQQCWAAADFQRTM